MPAKKMSREEAIAATKKGDLDSTLYALAASYIAPIFWEAQEPGEPTKLSSGTTFFLKTDRRQFAVTAAHVVDEYVANKAKYGRPCHVGVNSIYFDLEERLIARGRRIVGVDSRGPVRYKVDLATYHLTDEEFAYLGKQVREEPKWPPDRVPEGRGFFYAGFAAESREKIDERRWTWGTFHNHGIVTVATENDFVCRLERTEIVESPNLLPIPRVGYQIGGISGAPIFCWDAGRIGWALAGIIYDGGPGLTADGAPGELEIEQVRAVYADFIREDGRLLG